jgi:hypothetical protein
MPLNWSNINGKGTVRNVHVRKTKEAGFKRRSPQVDHQIFCWTSLVQSQQRLKLVFPSAVS